MEEHSANRSGGGRLTAMSGHFQPRCRPPVGLVRPVAVDPAGRSGPTRRQAQGRRWRRTTEGHYVPVDGTIDCFEQRVLEQSIRLPPGGAVTGRAALRLAGAAFFDGIAPDGRTPLPVPLVVPPTSRIRSTPESVVSREPLLADEMTLLHGIPATVPVRALFDEVRLLGAREGTVAVDMTAAAVLVSCRELGDYLDRHRRWRRSAVVEQALRYASEESASPGESRMRLLWVVDARLPRPLVNQPVFDDRGRLLGVADLLDPVAGVVGEYDGSSHRTARRHAADVGREHGMRQAGLEYFTVTGPDLGDAVRVVERMCCTRARALARPGRRGWTLEPPEGWVPFETAADRLDRRDWLRARDAGA